MAVHLFGADRSDHGADLAEYLQYFSGHYLRLFCGGVLDEGYQTHEDADDRFFIVYDLL